MKGVRDDKGINLTFDWFWNLTDLSCAYSSKWYKIIWIDLGYSPIPNSYRWLPKDSRCCVERLLRENEQGTAVRHYCKKTLSSAFFCQRLHFRRFEKDWKKKEEIVSQKFRNMKISKRNLKRLTMKKSNLKLEHFWTINFISTLHIHINIQYKMNILDNTQPLARYYGTIPKGLGIFVIFVFDKKYCIQIWKIRVLNF